MAGFNERVGNSTSDRVERMASAVSGATEKVKEIVDTAGHTAESAVRRTGQFVTNVSSGDVSSITDDLASLVRRYPIPAVVVSFGLGIFLASRR